VSIPAIPSLKKTNNHENYSQLQFLMNGRTCSGKKIHSSIYYEIAS